MGHRLPGEQLEGRIVVDVAILHQATVAVVGVFAETDVGHEDEPRRGPADGAERARDDAVGVGGAAPARVLPLRHAEEDDGRHAQVPEPPALLGRAVDRALRDARHRRDRLLHPTSGHDEERLHELGRVDARLAHQAAERLAAAETAGAIGGEAAHRGGAIIYRVPRGKTLAMRVVRDAHAPGRGALTTVRAAPTSYARTGSQATPSRA